MTHVSVLSHELIEGLAPEHGERAVDCTLGAAGHAYAVGTHIGARGSLLGIDQDEEALERARVRLNELECDVQLVHGNFADVEQHVRSAGLEAVDIIYFDLGWSSDQLESEEHTRRGFSFLREEPLLMTYTAHPEPTQLTAREIVNEWSEEQIRTIIRGYGGERSARRIAAAIVSRRKEKSIETTTELAELVKDVVPAPRKGARLHPATKTFQALRIAVNDELTALEEGLAGAFRVTAPGARIAVISFHELEDRIVKHTFRSWAKQASGETNKKPFYPSNDEIAQNPRARSARLRIFTKYTYAETK